MGEYYTIQQGESLSTIAHKLGFKSYKTIYNHPQNGDFRELRPNPNLIHPGDKLYIPDKEGKSEECASGKTHRFVITRDVRRIEIKVLDIDNQPLVETPYKLFLDGK